MVFWRLFVEVVRGVVNTPYNIKEAGLVLFLRFKENSEGVAGFVLMLVMCVSRLRGADVTISCPPKPQKDQNL